MRERRLEAWRRYEELPGPSGQEEEWRRTDLSLLRMDDALPYAASPLHGRPPSEWPRALRSLAREDTGLAGTLVQHESETIQDVLDEELASRGVIWCSLDRAVREHPDLVQRYLLSREVPGPHEKFVALHAALLSGGAFLYVPRDLDVTLPLRSAVTMSAPGLAVFPHTLVVAEAGSRVTLIEEHFSAEAEESAFSNALAEIYAGEGASVRYAHIQRWGQHVHNLNFLRSFQERGSSVTSVVVGLGGRVSKGHVEAFLDGEAVDEPDVRRLPSRRQPALRLRDAPGSRGAPQRQRAPLQGRRQGPGALPLLRRDAGAQVGPTVQRLPGEP